MDKNQANTKKRSHTKRRADTTDFKMELKTVFVDNDNFFEFKPEAGRLIYFLTGGRGTGKSFSAKQYVLKRLMLDPEFMFVYVRMSKTEIPTVDSWLKEACIRQDGLFSMLDVCPFPADEVVIKRGTPNAGALTAIFYENRDGTLYQIYERIIGYAFSMETSALIKSGWFEQVGCIVYEEYNRINRTIREDYMTAFKYAELIETICRERPVINICISNALSTRSELENMFIKDERAIKYKIISRKRKTGLLGRIREDVMEYMQGEAVFGANYVERDEFIPIYTVKWKSDYHTFYAHKVSPTKFAYSYETVPIPLLDVKYETRARFLNYLLFDNLEMLFFDEYNEAKYMQHHKVIMSAIRNDIFKNVR